MEIFNNSFYYSSYDTSLYKIQNYFLNSFPYSISLSGRKIFFYSNEEIGFISGFDFLNLFGYNKRDMKYYYTRIPFTEVSAIFGSKKEQFFKLLYMQNVTKQWNVGVNMLRMRSEGFYQRQQGTHHNFSFSTNYRSKNKRYALLGCGYVSSVKTDENGGIQNEMDFENNLFGNKKLISVNLSDARTRRATRGAELKQFLYFGRKDTVKENDTAKFTVVRQKGYVSLSSSVEDNWFVYEDNNPASGFYENIFRDSIKTLDSVHLLKYENFISYHWNAFREIVGVQHGINLSAKQELVFYFQNNFDTAFQNYILSGNIRPLNYISEIFGGYIFSGYQKGDYQYGIIFRIKTYSEYFSQEPPLVKKHFGSLYFLIRTFNVPFFYSDYSSNNFWWKNNFDKIFLVRGKILLPLKKEIVLAGSFTQILNHTYFDSTFLPRQFSNPINIISTSAEKNFSMKKFRFNNKLTYQYFSNDSIIHLPTFVSNHSVYYEDKWFKKVLAVQLGFDVTYFSSYYADAYMPALGTYYLQYEKKIGNYPFVDFFFNMKVKQAKIFFKTEHINSGLTGSYYLTPKYPAPDRSFKIGIKWVFYD